jgi:hypothetical protein
MNKRCHKMKKGDKRPETIDAGIKMIEVRGDIAAL